MSEFNVDKNILFMGCNKIEFQHPVENIKKCGNYYIVLINVPMENNVYAVNSKAQIVWQIEDAGIVYGIVNDVSYIGTRITDSGKVVVTNFNGVTYTVDPANGKIIGRGVTKQHYYKDKIYCIICASSVANTVQAVGGNIDVTYGLKGTAAAWGDLAGGAEQIITPFHECTLQTSGIIK